MEKTNGAVQFTMEQYQEAKEAAKGLGINPVGKKKEILIDLVNEALKAKAEQPAGEASENAENNEGQATAAAPKVKWYEETPLDVTAGDTIQIVSKTVEKAGKIKEILHNRYARVLGPSPRQNLIRVILLDEKTGEQQNCPITVEVGKYNKVPEGWVFVPTSSETPEEPAEDVQQTA